MDVAVARNSKQDIANRSVIDRHRTGSQTGEVDADQVGRGGNITSNLSVAVGVQLARADLKQSTGVGDRKQLVVDQLDARHSTTGRHATDDKVTRRIDDETAGYAQ